MTPGRQSGDPQFVPDSCLSPVGLSVMLLGYVRGCIKKRDGRREERGVLEIMGGIEQQKHLERRHVMVNVKFKPLTL